MIHIRTAESEDSAQLASIAEKSFRETFAAFNTKENMDEYCRKTYGTEIQRHEIADKDKCTLLCISDNKIVGYAQINWNSRLGSIQNTSQAEIQRIYILKDWHGKGLAQSLMNTVIDKIRQRKIKNIRLGVWEKNARAISFYKKFGFEELGEHIFLLGNDPQRDIIMNKVLEPQIFSMDGLNSEKVRFCF